MGVWTGFKSREVIADERPLRSNASSQRLSPALLSMMTKEKLAAKQENNRKKSRQ